MANPIRSAVAGNPGGKGVMPTPGRGAQAVGGKGFNPLAAGAKHYGGGRSMPNVGKVSSAGAAKGYNQRDVMANARRDALMRRAAGGN